MSKMKSILSVIFYSLYETVCYRLAVFCSDDCENSGVSSTMYILLQHMYICEQHKNKQPVGVYIFYSWRPCCTQRKRQDITRPHWPTASHEHRHPGSTHSIGSAKPQRWHTKYRFAAAIISELLTQPLFFIKWLSYQKLNDPPSVHCKWTQKQWQMKKFTEYVRTFAVLISLTFRW